MHIGLICFITFTLKLTCNVDFVIKIVKISDFIDFSIKKFCFSSKLLTNIKGQIEYYYSKG